MRFGAPLAICEAFRAVLAVVRRLNAYVRAAASDDVDPMTNHSPNGPLEHVLHGPPVVTGCTTCEPSAARQANIVVIQRSPILASASVSKTWVIASSVCPASFTAVRRSWSPARA